jgi:transcriptional regulator with XRE-family HTH domain
MNFGEKLSKLRKEKNYTQEQLAELIGVSRQAVSKWESGTAYPETATLIEIGKLFDCSMDYLLKEEITDKTAVRDGILYEHMKRTYEKLITEPNKSRAKRILKIAAIILAVILAVDFISLLVYICIRWVG